MANLIPMAGVGSRFAQEGYVLPKPLIPVSGIPMILRAIRDMPPSDKWIFVVRKEHIEQYAIHSLILGEIPDAIIIPVETTTEGQACTCLLAERYLRRDEPLLIAACDNGYLYDAEAHRRLLDDPTVDSIVWTFSRQPVLAANPTAWGWVAMDADGATVKDVSVKTPVSATPFNDHAVVATFWFRRAGDFIDAAKAMMAANHRIKNEFYVDSIPIFLRESGMRTVIFDVKRYIGWGTPADLYDYQRWEHFCSQGLLPPGADEESHALMTEYFATRRHTC